MLGVLIAVNFQFLLWGVYQSDFHAVVRLVTTVAISQQKVQKMQQLFSSWGCTYQLTSVYTGTPKNLILISAKEYLCSRIGKPVRGGERSSSQKAKMFFFNVLLHRLPLRCGTGLRWVGQGSRSLPTSEDLDLRLVFSPEMIQSRNFTGVPSCLDFC